MNFEVEPIVFAAKKLKAGETQKSILAMMLEKYPDTETELRATIKNAKKIIDEGGYDKLVEEKYKPRKGEEKTIVIEVEAREFDPQTGEKKSNAFRYSADERTFRNWYKNRRSLGLSINEVVYNPTDINIEVDSWGNKGNESATTPNRTAADV